jgi:hypothetical protein
MLNFILPSVVRNDEMFVTHPVSDSAALHTLLLGTSCIVLLCILAGIAIRFRNRISLDVLSCIGFTGIIFIGLRLQGYQPDWMQLTPIYQHPAEQPIFGHRLLFIWVAQAIHWIAPHLSTLSVYFISQVPAIFGAVWFVGRLARHFSASQILARLILVVVLLPTFTYYNFYDIGIVAFYAAALLFLFSGRYLLFVACVTLATLNHENSLLLVPVAFLVLGRKKWSTPFAALAGYAAVRLLLFWLYPMPRAGDIRFYTNAYYVTHFYINFYFSLFLLIIRWSWLAKCYDSASIQLKRATVLIPMLVVITYVFGKFHELRQFDAAIPLEVCFFLCTARALSTVSAQKRAIEADTPEIAMV